MESQESKRYCDLPMPIGARVETKAGVPCIVVDRMLCLQGGEWLYKLEPVNPNDKVLELRFKDVHAAILQNTEICLN